MMNNQTQESWIEAAHKGEQGTGIFLTRDYASTQLGAVLRTVEADMSYQRCLEIGIGAVAFKWVPYSVATQEQLQQALCSGYCDTACDSPGCVCNPELHLCQ